MPGPAPSRHPRRRNPTPGWVQLPPEGRIGAVPAWPLRDPADENERAVWTELWKLPQATQWEDLFLGRIVARYVRMLALAEAPDAPHQIVTETRQLEDRLGLTPKAMMTMRWEIIHPDEDEAAEIAPRERPKVVDPDAVA